MLKLSGVGPMFGMGGFQLLPFYEACRALGLRHYLINDERCGAFAADAYARVTNRPGVCDAHARPRRDQPRHRRWSKSLNAGMPHDRHRRRRQPRSRLEEHDAGGAPARDPAPGRQGADPRRGDQAHPRAAAPRLRGRDQRAARARCVLDVPEDVCHGEHDFDAADFWVDDGTLKAQARRTRPDPDELERAAALIAKAERPLLLVGGGIHISEGYDALLALAEAHGIPVAHTMSGKGAIACTHPLSAGLFGRYSRIANELVAASDCLIVVGCKLGEIATKRFR